MRDAFFASPKFPRLLNADSVKQTICRGVDGGMMAYVSKKADGTYEPFVFRVGLKESDVEVADDVFVIRKEDAEAYVEKQKTSPSGLAGERLRPEARLPLAGSWTIPLRREELLRAPTGPLVLESSRRGQRRSLASAGRAR